MGSFEEERNNNIRKTIEKFNIKEEIYHYTSIDAFQGMVENGEFWFGNAANMNDKSEVKDFIMKLETSVKDEFPQITDKCEDFFNKIFKRLSKEYPYVMSFSKLHDNAAQWERYANNAKGICIGFDTEKLLQVFCYSNTTFGDVYYNYDIKKHAHLKTISEYLNNGFLSWFQDEKALIDNIIACGYMHKHESFKSEEEFRLSSLWNIEINCSKICFEKIKGTIRKISKVNVKELCEIEQVKFEDLFSEIIIGPKSEQNPLELQEYLRFIGFDEMAERVVKSECPLR